MSLCRSSDSWSVVTHGLSEFSAAIVPSRRKPDDAAPLPWFPEEQAPSASTAMTPATAAHERRQPPAPIPPMCGTAIELTGPVTIAAPTAVS